MKLIINEKLPSLNEYINACRVNRFAGANFKNDIDNVISSYICLAVSAGNLSPTKNAVTLNFEWHERTLRRDPDNIASAKKYILDALQKSKIIINDNQKYVKGFSDIFISSAVDYVVVTIDEVTE